MCGFAGYLGKCGTFTHAHSVLLAMGNAIRHRGPDEGGVWLDPEADIGLSHRRLSVIDLTAAGNQPMMSHGGRFVIAFNGEIYNHLSLRSELQKNDSGPEWRGHSDTETLLAGFEAWGIEKTLQKTIGMFAFAVWDRMSRTLTLSRDRIGEKPLYYGWQGKVFLFASELKALRVHPGFTAEVDRGAISMLMRHGYVPAPYCIYRGIHKLLPGSMLTVSSKSRNLKLQRYWDASQAVANGLSNQFSGSPSEAVEVLGELLTQVVAQQMVADVPLGAFLSGGIDSSATVTLMQMQSSRPVRTFTIGTRESDYNEAKQAKAVALHLGTDHTELYVTPHEAMAVIPQLPQVYCEPFADVSQIPTFLVSRLARQHVKVSLSGDGGDELFGGYNRYVLGNRLWSKLSRVPVKVRRALAHVIFSAPTRFWDRLLRPLQPLFPSLYDQVCVGDKLHKGAGVITARTPGELYQSLVTHWFDSDHLVINGEEQTDPVEPMQIDHFVHQMMALDLLTYLPNDILCKVDRAAMAVSLETRIPMLDHRIVEFAWQLPLAYKLRDGVGKWPLRQMLYKYVPKELVERPKMGFTIPIDSWLRGPLREWAHELLDETSIRRDGYLNPESIRLKWEEHVSGKRNWQHHIWNVLMFQSWLKNLHSTDAKDSRFRAAQAFGGAKLGDP